MLHLMKTINSVCLCLAVLLALSGSADAKVYKWVDENGKTHFTDSPMKIPKGIKKKLPRREYKNTDIGWKCFIEMDAKLKKEIIKKRSHVVLHKRENVKNQKNLKAWIAKAEKFKDNPKKHQKALDAIDLTNERIDYLEDIIKLDADLRKVDKKKYKCR